MKTLSYAFGMLCDTQLDSSISDPRLSATEARSSNSLSTDHSGPYSAGSISGSRHRVWLVFTGWRYFIVRFGYR